MPKVAITHEHEMYTKEAPKQTENISNPKLEDTLIRYLESGPFMLNVADLEGTQLPYFRGQRKN